MELLYRGGWWGFSDVVDTLRERSDSVLVDAVTQKFDGCLCEYAFLPVYNHAVGFEDGKDVFEIFIVLIFILGRNENIVYVNKDAWDIAQDFIH